MRISVFYFILLTSLSFSGICQNRNITTNNTSKACIALNDTGVKYLQKNSLEKGPKWQLDSALYYFKEAVKCDSNYWVAYSNMELTYEYLKNYRAEMEAVDKLITLSHNTLIGLIKKGVLFEKLTQLDSAKHYYNLAKVGYDKLLQNKPDDIVVISNLIWLKAITDGKEAALKERDEQIRKNPKLSAELIQRTGYLQYFNRKDSLHLEK